MIFYRTILQHGALAPQDFSHHATLAEAHAAAKGYDKVNARPHVRVEMIDVDTNKAGVLSLLRGYSVQDGSTEPGTVRVLRAWDLTDRGGLAEMSDADLREVYGDDTLDVL
jgi:hypothetical protein